MIKWTAVWKGFLYSLFLVCLLYAIVLSNGVQGWLNPILVSGIGIVVLIWGRNNNQLFFPFAFLWLAFFLGSLLAADKIRSMTTLWTIGAGLILLLVATNLKHKQELRFMVLVIGGLVMIWSWLDAANWYSRWLIISNYQWIPSISFRLNGSNNIAAYLNLIFMFSACQLLFANRPWKKILWGIYAFSAILLIYLSSSRGAWVAGFAGFGTMILAISYYRPEKRKEILEHLKNNHWVKAFLIGSVFLLCLMIFLYVNQSRHPTHGPALTSRSEFWPVAWQAFLKSPVWGNGLNTYASFWLGTYSCPPQEIFLHAHNQYLDVLASAGLIGLVALLFFLYKLLKTFHLELKRSDENIPWVLGMTGATSAYLVHGVFDGLYRMPFVSISLVLMLGAILKPVDTLKRIGVIGRTGVCGLVLLVGFYVPWVFQPYNIGVQSFNEGDYAGSIEMFEKAVRRAPDFSAAHQFMGLAYSYLQGEENLLAAIRQYQAAISTDPNWALNHANLAALFLESGDDDAARLEIEKAVSLSPKGYLYWINKGVIDEVSGSMENAGQAYKKALTLNSKLFPADFWKQTTLRKEVADNYSQQNFIQPLEKWELLDLESVGAARAVDYIYLSEIFYQEGKLEAASQYLTKADLAYYSDPEEKADYYWQSARLSAADQDFSEAVRWGTLAMKAFSAWGPYGMNSTLRTPYISEVLGISSPKTQLVPQIVTISPDFLFLRSEMLNAWNEFNSSK